MAAPGWTFPAPVRAFGSALARVEPSVQLIDSPLQFLEVRPARLEAAQLAGLVDRRIAQLARADGQGREQPVEAAPVRIRLSTLDIALSVPLCQRGIRGCRWCYSPSGDVALWSGRTSPLKTVLSGRTSPLKIPLRMLGALDGDALPNRGPVESAHVRPVERLALLARASRAPLATPTADPVQYLGRPADHGRVVVVSILRERPRAELLDDPG